MTRSGSAVWVVVDAREVSDGLAAAMGTNQLLTSAAVRTCPTDQVGIRSEEHTSELQSLRHLVCRLLLEKKNRCNGIGRNGQEIANAEPGRGMKMVRQTERSHRNAGTRRDTHQTLAAHHALKTHGCKRT